jgi:hypothetical protein
LQLQLKAKGFPLKPMSVGVTSQLNSLSISFDEEEVDNSIIQRYTQNGKTNWSTLCLKECLSEGFMGRYISRIFIGYGFLGSKI